MKPHLHGAVSVKKFGGVAADYQAIHDFIDSSKACFPDMRHRAILHSAFGCYIVEKVFGITITNSDGKVVSTRDIAEQHIIDDMGRIPTVQDYLEEMPFYDWLGGKPKTKRKVAFEPEEEKAPEPTNAKDPTTWTPDQKPVLTQEEIKRLMKESEEISKGMDKRMKAMRHAPYPGYPPIVD